MSASRRSFWANAQQELRKRVRALEVIHNDLDLAPLTEPEKDTFCKPRLQPKAGLPRYLACGIGDAVNPEWPEHIAGDMALLMVESSSQSQVVTPSGWTLQSITENANGPRLTIFRKFAMSAREPAPKLKGKGFLYGCISTYAGVHRKNPIWLATQPSPMKFYIASVI